jgi:threonine synthase
MIPCENVEAINRTFHMQVWFKREDLNPNGSHKDRSIPFMITKYLNRGIKKFVISSSGNAAISASVFCKKHDLDLEIFLSPKTPKYKIDRIAMPQKQMHFTKKPVSSAFQFAKNNNYQLLRSSTDPFAIEGYKSIAKELREQIRATSDIFVPSSSGTLALGIFEGYKELVKKNHQSGEASLKINENDMREVETEKKLPRMHVVQTEKVNVLVRRFDDDFKKVSHSIAQAIVDRVGHRKKEVENMIEQSNGGGWVVNDMLIKKYAALLNKNNIKSSPEGAMGLAALHKALDNGVEIETPVCIITGKKAST